MRYFIGKDGQQLGPFDAQQVRDQLNAGAISYDDLLWREGMAAWLPVRTEFPPLAPPPLRPPGVAPSPPFGAPSPTFGGGFSGHAIAAEEPMLASRGSRLAAASIDHMIVLLCLLPGLLRFVPPFLQLLANTSHTSHPPDPAAVERMLGESFGLLILPVFILVVVQVVLLSIRGQTLGKMLCKIRIVRLGGEPAGFTHAVLMRVVLMGFVTSIPIIGGVIALVDPLLIFREDRRCLHDLLAGTAVIDA